MKLLRLLPVLAAISSALPAAAQTTHEVQIFTNVFLPDDLTIQVGDTVRWTWVVGIHNVVSGDDPGQFGNPNGIFSSGNPVVTPNTYEVLFDQAFLDANPVPGDIYNYYCDQHLPNQVGRIVVTTQPGTVSSYGFNTNPPLSLVVPSGSPGIGTNMTLRLTNPLDPAAGPGLGAAFLATAPDANFPAGTPVPGLGLSPNLIGEIVLSLAPPDPFLVLGPGLWAEGGDVDLVLTIPNDPSLVGLNVFAQGALIDTTTADGIGMTNGLQLTIG